MRTLLLDTETNGLPKNRYAPYTYPGAWPDIVQIAWQVWDFKEMEVPVCLQSTSMVVRPTKDVVWDKESEAIHKISRDLADMGVSAREVLSHLMVDAKEVDIVLIHNLAFDKPVVWSMSHKMGVDPLVWWPKREMCTMLETVGLCKIPSTSKYATEKDPYKWPRLEELYKTLFPTHPPLIGLHDARRDVDCLAACVEEVQRRRLVRFPAFPERRDPFVDLFRTVFRDFKDLRM